MAEPTTGAAVRAQARDAGFLNTEPAIARGAVMAVIGAIGTILVVFGVLTEEQRVVLVENSGTLAIAVLVMLPVIQGVVQAVWTRMSVFSPRSAAGIAVENADQPIGAPPTMQGPP